MVLRVESCSGSQIEQYIQDIARLRIEVFREFPYLYDGDLTYEENYLQIFTQSKKGVCVVVFDEEKVIGVSTGLPLVEEPDEVKVPWINASDDISHVFYFSESVLKKEYRGHGLGVKFFEERLNWARSLGFHKATFCSVVRESDHPLRPENYTPLDKFWQKRGFRKKDGFSCTMKWKEIKQSVESVHQLQFWEKSL